LNFRNNIIAGQSSNAVSYAPNPAPTGATTASITAWVHSAAYGNTMLAANTDADLVAPFNYAAPDFNRLQLLLLPQPALHLLIRN
jgi:hypothetical protein